MNVRGNIKSSVKAFICGALIANLSVGSIMSASAASSVRGQSLIFSNSGYNYSACNIINTGSDSNGNYATASTTISVTNGSSMPAGQMGACATIYDRSGRYISSSGIRYNSANVVSIARPITIRNITGSTAYYSMGYVEVWNGNGYTAFYPDRSPNLNDYS